MRFARISMLSAAAVLLSLAGASNSGPQPFVGLLRQHAERGEPGLENELRSGVIAAILPNRHPGEISAVGAIRVPVTVQFYLKRFRDIARFMSGPEVLAIDKFSSQPSTEALVHLSLNEKESGSLRKCKPGKCSLKLSGAMIQKFQGAQNQEAENHIFREVLWDYLSAYRKLGTPAMITYADRETPVRSADTFAKILSEFGWLDQYAPGLTGALKTGHATPGGQQEEFFYWSKDDPGLKPVVSITQVFVSTTNLNGHLWGVIASKQIYADHYLDGSLGVTILAADSSDAGTPGLSLAYFNSTITDSLRGWTGAIERAIVERRVRAALKTHLLETKQRLTSAFK